MSTKRFKTEKEFIEEFGEDWYIKTYAGVYFIELMKPALGEPFEDTLEGLELGLKQMKSLYNRLFKTV